MPYDYEHPPDWVKNLPEGAQHLCVDAFNSVYTDTGDETQARYACWAKVKTKYEQQGEQWVKKAKGATMIDLTLLDTVAKAYAAHNKLHGDYVDARWGGRRKEQVQADHEELVRHILMLGGRHLPKGEALDETLPEDLRESTTLRYVSPLIALQDTKPATSKIQVFRTGTFYHPNYGKFTITREALQTMIDNFQSSRPKPPTEMVVDYEHMSIAEPPQLAPAAGWVKGLSMNGSNDALFALVEWTAEAAAKIRSNEYRFISPEFSLNYKDKETNKNIGPTLLSVALTNRPFLEGMQPVILSRELASMVMSEGLFAQIDEIRGAYNDQFPRLEGVPDPGWVEEVFEKDVIVNKTGQYYRVPYMRRADGKVVFSMAAAIAVNKEYVPAPLTEGLRDTLGLAEWDAKYINDLPDGSFAYIAPGGEKDEEGRTVPRSLRYLPYKNMQGEIDLPHLRNALARLPQTSLSPEAKAKARAILVKAAQEAGVGEYEEPTGKIVQIEKEEQGLDEKALREMLAIDDKASLEDAVKAIKAKVKTADDAVKQAIEAKEAAEKRANELQGKLNSADAEKAVVHALSDRKILPTQKEWATALYLKDAKAFNDYLATVTTPVGPDLTIKGKDGGEPLPAGTEPTETELKIAKDMGVPEKALRDQKVRDKATGK